jgi:5'-nucleotidase (lipoprotein e(P4) family)
MRQVFLPCFDCSNKAKTGGKPAPALRSMIQNCKIAVGSDCHVPFSLLRVTLLFTLMMTLSGERNILTGNLLSAFTTAIMVMLSGCIQQPERINSHEMLNATLWQQTSAEYIGITNQIYRLARNSLDQALADTTWTAALEQTGDYSRLPPAIMLDIDETVLDNAPYEARIIKSLGQYSPSTFAEWCRNENAAAVPGVKAFLDYAVKQGVAVFYYSARREKLRECTVRNMRELALPLPEDSRLLLSNGTGKSGHRKMIASQYRILLLVGDNLEDFIDGSKSDPAGRRELAVRHAQRWGRQWVILPNAIYGHWESSAYNFDYQLPRAQQLQLKLQQLQVH